MVTAGAKSLWSAGIGMLTKHGGNHGRHLSHCQTTRFFNQKSQRGAHWRIGVPKPLQQVVDSSDGVLGGKEDQEVIAERCNWSIWVIRRPPGPTGFWFMFTHGCRFMLFLSPFGRYPHFYAHLLNGSARETGNSFLPIQLTLCGPLSTSECSF